MAEIIFEKKDLFTKASNILKNSIEKISLEKKQIILGLPGGRSITSILESLIKEDIPWEKIHIFMVDERLVPINDKESNFRLIKEGLKNKIPEKNLHPFIFNSKSIDFGIKLYESEIKKFGKAFDIVLVSAGEDGHIGALYPNHPSILDNSDYFIFVDNSPKPPSKRMSSSKKMILKSKIGIVIFSGEIKKESFLKFLNDNLDYTSCPAKLISNLQESHALTNIKIEE